MSIVICGAGVIGASIAYFLAERGVAATLVERSGIACAASGKSAVSLREIGVTASLRPSSLGPVSTCTRNSRALSKPTTATHASTPSSSPATTRRGRAPSGMASPDWLDGCCAVHSAIGSTATTATIHPERFTRALIEAACARGARLVTGAVDGMHGMRATAFARFGLTCRTRRRLGCNRDGPMVDSGTQWLPMPPVAGLKSYSVVLAPRSPVPAQALFVEHETVSGERSSPEVVVRRDGTVWACGQSSDDPLPVDPADVSVDAAKCREIARICAALSSHLDGAEVVRTQACYRPICADAMPLLGPVLASQEPTSQRPQLLGMLNARQAAGRWRSC